MIDIFGKSLLLFSIHKVSSLFYRYIYGNLPLDKEFLNLQFNNNLDEKEKHLRIAMLLIALNNEDINGHILPGGPWRSTTTGLFKKVRTVLP